MSIYIASKAKHGARWRTLRASGVPIISSWIDESEPGQTVSFPLLWVRNIREAASARVLIAYNEPGESPKGSLVEVGAALGAGNPVLWVGPSEGQTVVEHPLVTLCSSLEEALGLV